MSFSFEINPRLLTDLPPPLPSHQTLHSIYDYQQHPLLPLEQACQPLHDILGTELQLYMTIANLNCQQPKHGLTQDESASIYLYTMEWNEPHHSLHVLLNQALSSLDPNQLQPWLNYLKLFYTALFKLPYAEYDTLWHGVAKDVGEEFREGDEVTWWSLTSMTSSFDALQSPMYLGREEVQTVFSIETKYGKSIREHSHVQNDDEIVLLPGVTVKVVGSSKGEDGIQIVQLCEVGLPDDFIVDDTIPVADGYRNPELGKIIQASPTRGKLTLDSMNLNDQDMEIVVKLGLIEKRCMILSLRDNLITSVGASILSEAFLGNTAFKSLILDGNRILDVGVQSLAKGLSDENIYFRTLYLNSVGMSDAGCEYLAEAIRINHCIIYLFLNNNEITDRGVRVLLESIRSGQCGLTMLTLSGNNLITDDSVDVICSAISTNITFHQLHLCHCSLTPAGQDRIRQAAQRSSFVLYL
ncbi:unnamed protein product [Adineta ricciae]|uniref:NAD(P)(+)--arginine ADP-ribosyltransferase n=1 Tax=Adineta ricciae TaxID=249248 RepID=A0A814U6K8_ADIRI|nr:unnamed protein product [Adineta ricciae]